MLSRSIRLMLAAEAAMMCVVLILVSADLVPIIGGTILNPHTSFGVAATSVLLVVCLAGTLVLIWTIPAVVISLIRGSERQSIFRSGAALVGISLVAVFGAWVVNVIHYLSK
jgi:hypothetical protein